MLLILLIILCSIFLVFVGYRLAISIHDPKRLKQNIDDLKSDNKTLSKEIKDLENINKDDLLDKLSVGGWNSLTKDEIDYLRSQGNV